MDRLRALDLFVRVCDRGNFSEVARELGLAQSVVSRGVARLEAEVGATLLHRTTRQVTVTEVGERFLARVRVAMAELSRAEDEIADAQASLSGTIRVGTAGAFGRRFVIPSVLRFMHRFPGVEVDIQLNDNYADLGSERLDVVVRFGPLEDSSLQRIHLGASRLVAVAAPTLLEAHADALAEGRVEEVPGVFLRSGGTFHRGFVTVDGELIEGGGARRLVVNDIEAAHIAAREGVGITALPEWLAGDDLTSGRLQRILTHLRLMSLPVNMLFRPEVPKSARVQAMINHLRAELLPVLTSDR